MSPDFTESIQPFLFNLAYKPDGENILSLVDVTISTGHHNMSDKKKTQPNQKCSKHASLFPKWNFPSSPPQVYGQPPDRSVGN